MFCEPFIRLLLQRRLRERLEGIKTVLEGSYIVAV
jgi:hypothetical protein